MVKSKKDKKVNMVSSSIKAKKSKSPVCMVHSVDNSEEKVAIQRKASAKKAKVRPAKVAVQQETDSSDNDAGIDEGSLDCSDEEIVDTGIKKSKVGVAVKNASEKKGHTTAKVLSKKQTSLGSTVNRALKKVTESSEEDSEEGSEDDSHDENGKVSRSKDGSKLNLSGKPTAMNSNVESSDDENHEPSGVKAGCKPGLGVRSTAKNSGAKNMESSEEDSEENGEEDSEEDGEEDSEEETVTPTAVKASTINVPVGKTQTSSEEEDSEEEDSEEEDGEQDESDNGVDGTSTQAPVKPMVTSDNEEDDDEDEEESGESGDESEDAEPPVLSVTIGNAKHLEEKQIKILMKSNKIKFTNITRVNKKTFQVELQGVCDTEKAVALSGVEVGGKSISVQPNVSRCEPAQTKETVSKGKKRATDTEEKVQTQEITKKRKLNDGEASEEVATMFFGRLNPETSQNDIEKFLKKHKVPFIEVRKPDFKKFAYVDLTDGGHVEKVMALSGSDLAGCEVSIDRARPRNDQQSSATNRGDGQRGQQRESSGDDATLFVKGLSDSVNESKLREFFPDAISIRLPMKDGYHRGFAFIQFSDTDSATGQMSEKQGAELEGQSLYIDYTGAKSSFKPKDRSFGSDRSFGNSSFGSSGGGRGGSKATGERGSSTVLFVGNLSFGVDEDTLKECFPQSTDARVAKFPDTQKPRGFGFVDFSNPDDCANAFDEMNNQEIDGRAVSINFSSGQKGGRGRGGFGDRGRGGFGDRGRGGFGNRGRGGFGNRGRGGFGDGGRGRGRGGFGGRGRGGGFDEPANKKKKFDSDSD